MSYLRPQSRSLVKLFLENCREQPELPVRFAPNSDHERVPLEFREDLLLSSCLLAYLQSVLHEEGELRAEGVYDVLRTLEPECPCVAAIANRVYELEDSRVCLQRPE